MPQVDATAPRDRDGGPQGSPRAGGSSSEQVVRYFEQEFGPVDSRSLTEIVPTTEPPVRVHVVRPNPRSGCVTLFTTGLSSRPMTVPEGAEDYRFAELFVQLPADWPVELADLSGSEHGWPAAWLRVLAGVPRAEGTWLGGGGSTIASADPPVPFSPGLPFTVAWLVAERSLVREDANAVQLYRFVPITTEEWKLVQRDGVAALGAAFDSAEVQMVVDPTRKSAA